MMHLKFRFTGRVQGVGFRYFCQEAAESRRLNGWVKNCLDGSVEMAVEGEKQSLEGILGHLKSGHPWARIDKCETTELAPLQNHYTHFEIRF